MCMSGVVVFSVVAGRAASFEAEGTGAAACVGVLVWLTRWRVVSFCWCSLHGWIDSVVMPWYADVKEKEGK